MVRSVWKGPFVEGSSAQEGGGRARVRPSRRHQDLEPSLDDPAAVRRPDFRRLQRPEARAGRGQRGNGRSQVRRVLADPDLPRPSRRQESQEGLIAMSKPKRERALPDNEAKAIARMLRVSPQKLNLVAQMIRGRKAAAALADLQFSRKRIAVDVQEVPGIGDRQCREQSLPRRRRSDRLRGACRQGHRHEAFRAARPWPFAARIFKPFAQLTIVVRQVEARSKRCKRARERHDGSEDQSDRPASRHQPDLGFALVRRQERVRQAAA